MLQPPLESGWAVSRESSPSDTNRTRTLPLVLVAGYT